MGTLPWNDQVMKQDHAVFDCLWDIELGYDDGIVSHKVSIGIQENFHNHVPVFESHHDCSLPSVQHTQFVGSKQLNSQKNTI